MKHTTTGRTCMAIVMLLCLVFPLTAGGQAESDSQETAQKINVFAYQFQNDENRVKIMADAYMAAHPGIEITVEEYPWDTYFQNLEVRFSADTPNIDLVVMDIPLMANYADRGFIDDLTKYIPKETFTQMIAEKSLADVTYNGRIMASPMQNSDQYLYINAAMAEEAGITLPPVVVDKDTMITGDFAEKWGAAAWTWEEVVDAAVKMTRDIDGDGIIDVHGLHIEQAGRLYQLQPLGGSRGGKIVSPDGTTVKGYFDQPVWLKAVTFYGDLFNTYKVEVPSGFLPGYDAPAEFVNGSYAMMVGGGWNLKRLTESGLDVVVAAHPYFADGNPTTPTGSWVTGIAKSAPEKNKQLAADFLQWWTLTEEGSQLWYDANGELPATKYMLDQLSTNPKYDRFPLSAQRLGVYQVLNTAEGRPVTPFYPFVNTGFDKAFTDAAQGVDPQRALSEAVAEIEKNISRVR
ncbi:MAG: sugar ABC transporter substrate-binding protein [Spirochaetia bacterium]|nr:sugar ABC transporter substrate-binding protein [Spirochaetia bacterium]MCF7940612.1 sugar ABC transporter substrate-binding protein [Spirochaetia bacterium]